MIYDAHGRLLKRSIGFTARFEPERAPRTRQLVDAISWIGFTPDEDESEMRTQQCPTATDTPTDAR